MLVESVSSRSPDAQTQTEIESGVVFASALLKIPDKPPFPSFLGSDGRQWKSSAWTRDGKLRWVRIDTEDEAFQLGQLREPYPHADHIKNGVFLKDEPSIETVRSFKNVVQDLNLIP